MASLSWVFNNYFFGVHQCGVCGWRIGAKGKAVLPFDIWIHILVILFYPTLVSQCNALPKKVSKELYKRNRQKQIRGEDVSFILSFIYWVQQPFRGWGSFSWIHWNGWISQLRCQKYVNSFHVCRCPHLVFRASIKVSFLLEVLSESGKG